MTPAETLLAIAARFAELPDLPPGSPDAYTQRQAPVLLSRLATKIASEDPAVSAHARENLIAIGAAWRDRTSPGAKLWAEALAAIGEAMPEPEPVPPKASGPDAAMLMMLAAAYERGRAKGREEMRERCAAIAEERLTYGLTDTIARDIRAAEIK